MPNETHRAPLRYNISDFFSSLLDYPFILERQESLPEERPRGVPVYIKDAGTRTFSRRRWFGLGSPIVPVV